MPLPAVDLSTPSRPCGYHGTKKVISDIKKVIFSTGAENYPPPVDKSTGEVILTHEGNGARRTGNFPSKKVIVSPSVELFPKKVIFRKRKSRRPMCGERRPLVYRRPAVDLSTADRWFIGGGR